jgi:hypothetical protein
MPWTPRQVRYLESKSSPLSAVQKESMNSELHSMPAMGHMTKGSKAMKRGSRFAEAMRKRKLREE